MEEINIEFLKTMTSIEFIEVIVKALNDKQRKLFVNYRLKKFKLNSKKNAANLFYKEMGHNCIHFRFADIEK